MNPAIQVNDEGLDAILATSELKQNPREERSQRLTILVGLVCGESHAKRAVSCDAVPIGILAFLAPRRFFGKGSVLFAGWRTLDSYEDFFD